jgi:hypothetical protein
MHPLDGGLAVRFAYGMRVAGPMLSASPGYGLFISGQ